MTRYSIKKLGLLETLFILVFILGCSGNGGKVNELVQAAPEDDMEKTSKIEEDQTPAIDTNQFTLSYIMGKFDPAKHEDFERIDAKYARSGQMFLRKDTYEAFKTMYDAALKDGITLKILSATRNFEAQKRIWEAKWTGKRILSSGEDASKAFPNPKDRALKILEYSSMPSTSRHHWGTDVDFNSLNNKYFESGNGKKVYDWLVKNAGSFGFCQTYTQKGSQRPNGYNEEKWHWSYMPIAKVLTTLAAKELKNDAIEGFLGAETASEINVVENYILGINPACK